MSTTIKTKLHHYQFPSGNDPEYKAMVKKIKANFDGRGHWMNALHDPRSKTTKPNGTVEDVELEVDFIFGNQWNTKDGRRVFDWYEAIVYNNGIKGRCRFGHWLEITPEMAALRRNTFQCGYCGKHHGEGREPVPANGFCESCLDSPYLKESELYLLRLLPVADVIETVFQYDQKERQPLTAEELADLKPKYVERQTTGNTSRAVEKRAKQREKIEHDYEVDSTNAKNERDGMIWLLDHDIDIENVIYYSHTGKFSFGWRNPYSPDVRSKMLDLLCEFPFDYEFAADKKR